ncbi:MAG TPA: flavodoxin [Rhodanobacteraceae bacterium]|nr:flavodoxin [Rhodanobacteraceae bacterium]
MKYKWISTLVCAAFLGLVCATAMAQNPGASRAVMDKADVLIVYLSRTRNTQAVAEIIHDAVGGTLVRLELKTPYPEDYAAIVAQVAKEDEAGYLPPLTTRIADIRQFKTVFIGFPTWGMQLPPPIKSFLKEYDLRGKTVIPFNTNAGYGVGSSIQQVRSLCTGCNVQQGYSTKGGLERDSIYLAIEGKRREAVRGEVRKWLREIGALQPGDRSNRGAAAR